MKRVLTVVVILLLFAVVAPLGEAQAPLGPYSTDPILAGGTDGTIWDSEVVGDQVWVGGTFDNVRNHFVLEEIDVPSRNLGVIDLNTGRIREDRTFQVNGPVLAIELVDDVVWIGGDFSSVDGESRQRLAAFDAFSGELLPVAPGANGRVWDLLFHDGWLYVGGEHGRVGGSNVEAVARVDPITGVGDGSWRPPDVPSEVISIAAHGDLILADTMVYSIANPAANTELRAADAIASDFSPDGAWIVTGNTGNDARAYRVSDIQLNGDTVSAHWSDGEASGDIQAVGVTDDAVWFGLHQSYDGNSSVKLVKVNLANGRVDNSWYVEMDSFWGVESIEPTPQGLIVTGYFENVNGIEARRYAFFPATDPVEPARPLRPDGDVSCGSGAVVNALMIAQYLVGDRTAVATCPLPNPVTAIRANRGDVSADGQLTILDALFLAQCDVGIANEVCPA